MKHCIIKLSQKELLLLLLNIIIFIFSIVFLEVGISNKNVTILSIISTTIIAVTFKKIHGNILGFGFVFMLYNMILHFGLGVVYFLMDSKVVEQTYAPWTLDFLKSQNYSYSVLLAIVAFEIFTIWWVFGMRLNKNKTLIKKQQQENNSTFYMAGIVMLLITIIFFVVCLLIGVISLSSSYQEFRAALADKSQIYNYILIIYATGLVYVVASSEGKKLYLGIMLFLASAVILLLTGNKGEVFYAVLAVLGIWGYKNHKMNFKMVLIIGLIVFLVIPVVTATRSGGVINNLDSIGADFYEPIMEIGMQIRCVVYSVDRIFDGTYTYMFGYSYLRPILNIFGIIILPLRMLQPIPINFNADYSGMGFSQVAESYLNFGIWGVVVFFALLGFIFGKKESKEMSSGKLCLFGSILVILINASRNTFIFVPGQVFLMIMLYVFIKYFLERKKK